MAYSELIKNFGRIRDYMRGFYVYGFKSRSDYNEKSARSYDNERRRIESWLGDHMFFRQDASGKNIFISVDSRSIPHNPLYNAFKAKSFTDNDIIFHFYVLDMLSDGQKMTVREIADKIEDSYLSEFRTVRILDESTIRKKLKKYENLGMIDKEKHGREMLYSRSDSNIDLDGWHDAVSFFSEAGPAGIAGSYLLDRSGSLCDIFRFKHHYILYALDSEILITLLEAMSEKRCAEVVVNKEKWEKERSYTVYPYRLYISTANGRQYLFAYVYYMHKAMFFRLDSIKQVTPGVVEKRHIRYGKKCDALSKNVWGVSLGKENHTDHIEMYIHVSRGEEHIIARLEREKRCGSIDRVDRNTWRFSADVYDAGEMLPWIRSFIGRILKIECSNAAVTERFYADLDRMYEIYGSDGYGIQ